MRSFIPATGLSLVALANALTLDVNSPDSVKNTAKTVAAELVSRYDGTKPGNPIGVYGTPYYWWSSGAIWESLIDYWATTGDTAHNDIVRQALLAQLGRDDNFMPANWTVQMGNDDQATWALASLAAAEWNLPLEGSNHTWLAPAVNAFQDMAARWDAATCEGGLRWQIMFTNNGYDYKNAASNARFFQLSARLAHLTQNQTYADWAKKSYDWLATIGYLTPEGAVYDGARVTDNCTSINKLQFSSDAGAVLYGAALLYNLTSDDQWTKAVQTVLNKTAEVFFKDGVLAEASCEGSGTCNVDMYFFKGLLAQSLARTARVAPFTHDTIAPLLRSSAKAAAEVGCANNGSCVAVWTGEGKGAASQVGSQFSALSAIQAVLEPVANATQGNSASGGQSGTGNGNGNGAGGGSSSASGDKPPSGTNAGNVAKPVSMISLAIALVGVHVLL